MKTNTVCLFLFGSLLSISGMAQPGKDSTQVKRNYTIDEVVVTGTRNETDIRHLPMTISVVGRQQIEKRYEPSLLPLLTEQVPGFFTTSRGIMGYGVSTGAAGGMSLRGIGGSPTAGLLVLIDGHPQYMGLMGHPIADAYQSMSVSYTHLDVYKRQTLMTSDRGRFEGILDFLFRKIEGLKPEQPVKAVKTNLRKIGKDEEVLVWFGHSSYLIQTGGKRILVDPVFSMASPVSFVNKAFKDVYKRQEYPCRI